MECEQGVKGTEGREELKQWEKGVESVRLLKGKKDKGIDLSLPEL